MQDDDEEPSQSIDAEVTLEGRVKALEIIVLLLFQDAAKDERRISRVMSSLRHLARELRVEDGEDGQVALLIERRTSLLGRLASKYRDEPFD